MLMILMEILKCLGMMIAIVVAAGLLLTLIVFFVGVLRELAKKNK